MTIKISESLYSDVQAILDCLAKQTFWSLATNERVAAIRKRLYAAALEAERQVSEVEART